MDAGLIFNNVKKKMEEKKVLSNSAIIFIPQRNASRFVEKCLDSVISQDYDDLGIIFMDDASDDNTVELAKKKLQGRKDVVFHINETVQPKILSIKQVISELCVNPQSAMFWLDGDDWLLEPTAISEMMECHNKYDIVWSQYFHRSMNRTGCCGKLTDGNIRKHRWVSSAMRSFKKYLFDKIQDHSFRHENEYLASAIDVSMMFPMLEMAGNEKCHFLNRVFYYYNDTPNSMHGTAVGAKKQRNNELVVRAKRAYRKLRDPKISVVIPCYNQAQYLKRSVESVVRQTFKDYEIIIVDDGSQDNCIEVAKELQSTYPEVRIFLVRQKNKGLSAARNIGIERARGKWILPLDADDFIKPKMLELCYNKGMEGCDIVYTDVFLMQQGIYHTMIYSPELILKRNCFVCSSLFKKSLWNEAKYNEEMKEGYEDWDFWLSCLENGAKVGKQKGDLFIYDNTRSSMRENAEKKHGKLMKVLRRNHPEMFSNGSKGLSVVMSSYNQLDSLKYALKAIEMQSIKPLEVIIADDGSTDGTLEWLDSHDCNFSFELKYFTREHSGYKLATIHNDASKYVNGSRILFTNGDVMHSPNSIKYHMKLKDDVIGGGIIDGVSTAGVPFLKMEMLDDFEEVKRLRKSFPSYRNNYHFVYSNPTPLGIWGGNFSVPTEKFKKATGYDKGYELGYGGEDSDLADRLIRLGCKIEWVHESLGVHIDHDQKSYIKNKTGSKKYYGKKALQ
jgi:glycosyltransferase involved in cell wall biosynthesis